LQELVNYHLVAKWFVGLAVDEPAPDHTTLTVFKCPIRGTRIASSKRMAGRSWLAVSIIFSSKPENKAFPDLLAHHQALQLPTTTYGGDRAYDDTDIYEPLEVAGLHSGISRH